MPRSCSFFKQEDDLPAFEVPNIIGHASDRDIVDVVDCQPLELTGCCTEISRFRLFHGLEERMVIRRRLLRKTHPIIPSKTILTHVLLR